MLDNIFSLYFHLQIFFSKQFIHFINGTQNNTETNNYMLLTNVSIKRCINTSFETGLVKLAPPLRKGANPVSQQYPTTPKNLEHQKCFFDQKVKTSGSYNLISFKGSF